MSIPYRDRILSMYEAYCPTKLSNVPTLLRQYEGRERELLDALILKYGKEPLGKSMTIHQEDDDVSLLSQFQRRKVQYIKDIHRAQKCELQCRIRDLENQISRQEQINALQNSELDSVRDAVATAEEYQKVTSAPLEAQAQSLIAKIATLRAHVFDLSVHTDRDPLSLMTVEEYGSMMNRVSLLRGDIKCLRDEVSRMGGIVDTYLRANLDCPLRMFLKRVRPGLECRICSNS